MIKIIAFLIIILLAWFGIANSKSDCKKYRYIKIGNDTLGATIGVCNDE